MESTWAARHREAVSLQAQGRFQAAEQQYQAILRVQSQADAVWHDLGWLYYQMGQYQLAAQALLKALELNRQQSSYHYKLGLVLEKLGDRDQAVQAHRNAIQLDEKLSDAYSELGRLLVASSKLDEAEGVYQQAIAVHPQQAQSYFQLGQVLAAKAQFPEAIKAYEVAHQLNPADPQTLQELGQALDLQASRYQARAAFFLGSSFYCQEKYAAAAEQYQEFIHIPNPEAAAPTMQRAYKYLGECLQKLEQSAEAIALYYQGIQRYPEASEFYYELIALLQNSGRTKEAIAVATQGLQHLPDDLHLLRAQQLMLPILYQNAAEIEQWREHLILGLNYLVKTIDLTTPEVAQKALLGIGYQTNFYLQYQGQDDLALQVQYGQLMHQIMAANYPDWVKPLQVKPRSLQPNQQRKIRIGYISNFLWQHTVGKLFVGWIRHHNSDQFELYCYHLGPAVDQVTEKIRQHSYEFNHLPLQEVLEADFQNIGSKIRADQLDILVFLDIGMHPFVTSLSGLRLAPIQCVTWGHPITSGSPTIDYFLSSDLMEPETAEAHYSEKLVRLPNIGISYTKPQLPPLTKSRSNFQIPQDAIAYLCCQSLFKYLPQYDYIFPAIVQQVPQAQFIFISGFDPGLTQQFEQRLEAAFAQYHLNYRSHCIILPKQSQTDYWQINLLSDIFLDTFAWSGGNTTLEAIACNLPIVTCPGEFMRGRHSYAILQRLGVTATIAKDEAAYIEIAVKLGLDCDWRSQVVQQMSDRQSFLYDDLTCVTALEEFYQRVIGNH
ncbi:glycosyltransferase family 41 protein [Trichocoleus sp. FACHB-262]|uniref:tetratricopeptide repeat protein n=1 Tax=Trichocoleus sp. FACHB-262 TaxID=2692869 RepID=UPI0016876C9B|nr:glycosyltransferase family 41 protein [Trichocoleus sp. FACHB-262]MBD2119941.1 tetratricopeptide repeat protein [Trichocoleus sp. FACHB-262]